MGKGADLFRWQPGPEEVAELSINEGHMSGIKALFDVARQNNPESTTLPSQENIEAYVSEELAKKKELLGKLCMAGLGYKFKNPDFMMGFSVVGESVDLPIEALLEYMSQEEMLLNSKAHYVDWLKGFHSVQTIEFTGGILLQDKKIRYRGDSLKSMNDKNSEVSKTTRGKYSAEMLGVILNLQRYAQNPDFRSELNPEGGLSVYTPDRTAYGGIVSFVGWNDRGHSWSKWDGIGDSYMGTSSAVMEK